MLRAMLLVAGFRVALRILPFRIVQRAALGARSLGARHRRDVHVPASRIIWAVTTAARYIPGATCLPQALAAHRLLTRAGHDSRIEIGVARDEQERFKAHAWVVFGGVVVIGATPDHYTPLAALEMRS